MGGVGERMRGIGDKDKRCQREETVVRGVGSGRSNEEEREEWDKKG